MLPQLEGLVSHLREACVGSISEIFDAEAPYAARLHLPGLERRGSFARMAEVQTVERRGAETNAGGAGGTADSLKNDRERPLQESPLQSLPNSQQHCIRERLPHQLQPNRQPIS